LQKKFIPREKANKVENPPDPLASNNISEVHLLFGVEVERPWDLHREDGCVVLSQVAWFYNDEEEKPLPEHTENVFWVREDDDFNLDFSHDQLRI
jgi:hypothetical protein